MGPVQFQTRTWCKSPEDFLGPVERTWCESQAKPSLRDKLLVVGGQVAGKAMKFTEASQETAHEEGAANFSRTESEENFKQNFLKIMPGNFIRTFSELLRLST